MSETESTRSRNPIGNPIIAVLDQLLRQAGPGRAMALDQLLQDLLNWPAEQFTARPSQADLAQVHDRARTAIAAGRIPEALAWCATNLMAAGAVDAWQWAEWIQGLLLNHVVPHLDAQQADLLDWYLEHCNRRFRFDRDPHARLGLLTLQTGLCGIRASQATMARRETLLTQAVDLCEQALKLARSLEAAPGQIAAIRLQLGRDLTALFRLGTNSDFQMLLNAVLHLQACLDYSIATGLPLRFEAEQGLAAAAGSMADVFTILLDEPALGELWPQDSDQIQGLFSRNLRSSIVHLTRAIRHLPVNQPRGQEIGIDLHRELIARLIQQASHTPRHAPHLLCEAERRIQALRSLVKAQGKTGPMVSMYQLLASLRAAQHDLRSGTTLESVIAAHRQALEWARKEGSPWQRWEAAGRLGAILFRSGAASDAHAPAAFDLFREAAQALLEMADEEQPDERFLRLTRAATRWFWEPFLSAGAGAGELGELPRVFEMPAALCGGRRTKHFDDLPDRSAVARALPGPDCAVVYMYQGASAFHGFIVHRGPPDQADLIVEDSASWERLRALVDPWIRANQRLREPGADGTDLARLHRSLGAVLEGLGPMLMDRLVSRLSDLGIRRVTIVRGLGLGILPLHAVLVTCPNAAQPAPTTPDTLLKCLIVSYAPSGLDAARPRFPAPESGRLLAVGDPRGDLPWSEAEIHLVADAFGPARTTRLIGRKARRDWVLPRLAEADVVHLATHAEYEIAREGLVTRGEGELQLADGGSLDTTTIDAMTLGRRPILILSACETGRADWRDLVGQGIADHFLARGAAAVVATLWVVDDLSTALLMWKLHQLARHEQDLATALRSAQLWLRALHSDDLRVLLDRAVFRQALARSGRAPTELLNIERPFAEPFHWAPFHLLTSATQR